MAATMQLYGRAWGFGPRVAMSRYRVEPVEMWFCCAGSGILGTNDQDSDIKSPLRALSEFPE